MDGPITNVLTFAVFGFMGVRLVSGLRYSRSATGRSLTGEIVRGIRWRHIWPVPIVLAVVLAVATPLMYVPGLSWGWWSALGGQGNPVFGSSTATAGSALEWLVPMLFVALLIPALPLFAHAEEVIFRRGAQRWSWNRRVFKVVQFGSAHALIGIPIGAALALSLGGAYFMSVYLRAARSTGSENQATLESARAHTVYNAIIIVAVVLVIATGAAS
ncbi:MAG: hypothetical protein ABIQ39_00340 [Ilumatobacteraceae bacterium]